MRKYYDLSYIIVHQVALKENTLYALTTDVLVDKVLVTSNGLPCYWVENPKWGIVMVGNSKKGVIKTLKNNINLYRALKNGKIILENTKKKKIIKEFTKMLDKAKTLQITASDKSSLAKFL